MCGIPINTFHLLQYHEVMDEQFIIHCTNKVFLEKETGISYIKELFVVIYEWSTGCYHFITHKPLFVNTAFVFTSNWNSKKGIAQQILLNCM